MFFNYSIKRYDDIPKNPDYKLYRDIISFLNNKQDNKNIEAVSLHYRVKEPSGQFTNKIVTWHSGGFSDLGFLSSREFLKALFLIDSAHVPQSDFDLMNNVLWEPIENLGSPYSTMLEEGELVVVITKKEFESGFLKELPKHPNLRAVIS